MTGWIRFAISAVFIVTGLISFASGVIGNCRFGYVMNRVHAGGIGDTQGLFDFARKYLPPALLKPLVDHSPH